MLPRLALYLLPLSGTPLCLLLPSHPETTSLRYQQSNCGGSVDYPPSLSTIQDDGGIGGLANAKAGGVRCFVRCLFGLGKTVAKKQPQSNTVNAIVQRFILKIFCWLKKLQEPEIFCSGRNEEGSKPTV